MKSHAKTHRTRRHRTAQAPAEENRNRANAGKAATANKPRLLPAIPATRPASIHLPNLLTMPLTYKQKQIIRQCELNGGRIDQDKAVEMVGREYDNPDYAVRSILIGMVRDGLLSQVLPGVYQLKETNEKPGAGKETQQPQLFEI